MFSWGWVEVQVMLLFPLSVGWLFVSSLVPNFVGTDHWLKGSKFFMEKLLVSALYNALRCSRLPNHVPGCINSRTYDQRILCTSLSWESFIYLIFSLEHSTDMVHTIEWPNEQYTRRWGPFWNLGGRDKEWHNRLWNLGERDKKWHNRLWSNGGYGLS